MNFTIAPVVASDAAEIAALLNPHIARGDVTAIDDQETESTQRDFIASLPPRAIYLAARENAGSIVAIQDILPDTENPEVGEISTFVREDCIRRGIGRELTTATLDRAGAVGYRTIRATIRRENERAQRFYEAQDFEPTASSDTKDEPKTPSQRTLTRSLP